MDKIKFAIFVRAFDSQLFMDLFSINGEEFLMPKADWFESKEQVNAQLILVIIKQETKLQSHYSQNRMFNLLKCFCPSVCLHLP